jgi:hypothetical protein
VVAGDQVRQQPCGALPVVAAGLRQLVQGMQRAGCRVTLVAQADAAAFDMGVLVLPHVLLEAGAELAEVVPETGQMAPGARRRWAGQCRPASNFLQM